MCNRCCRVASLMTNSMPLHPCKIDLPPLYACKMDSNTILMFLHFAVKDSMTPKIRPHWRCISRIWLASNTVAICIWLGTAFLVVSINAQGYALPHLKDCTHFLLTASFGGIFGLCLGGSVISFVEILYYFTIKLYNRITSRRYDEKRKRMEKTVGIQKQHQRQHPNNKPGPGSGPVPMTLQQQQPHVKKISVEPTIYYPTKPSIDAGHGGGAVDANDNKLSQMKLNTNRMAHFNPGRMGRSSYFDFNRPSIVMQWNQGLFFSRKWIIMQCCVRIEILSQ